MKKINYETAKNLLEHKLVKIIASNTPNKDTINPFIFGWVSATANGYYIIRNDIVKIKSNTYTVYYKILDTNTTYLVD